MHIIQKYANIIDHSNSKEITFTPKNIHFIQKIQNIEEFLFDEKIFWFI